MYRLNSCAFGSWAASFCRLRSWLSPATGARSAASTPMSKRSCASGWPSCRKLPSCGEDAYRSGQTSFTSTLAADQAVLEAELELAKSRGGARASPRANAQDRRDAGTGRREVGSAS